MSLAATNWAWFHSKAEGVEHLVLLALAYFADDDGLCWPAQSQVVSMTHSDRRSVQRALDALEAAGELVVVSPARGRRTTRYRVQVDPDTLRRGGVYPPLRTRRIAVEAGSTTRRGGVTPPLNRTSKRTSETPSVEPCEHGEARGPRACAICRWRVHR